MHQLTLRTRNRNVGVIVASPLRPCTICIEASVRVRAVVVRPDLIHGFAEQAAALLTLVAAGAANTEIPIMQLVELSRGFMGHFLPLFSTRPDAPIGIRRGLGAAPDMSAMSDPNPNSITGAN